MSQFVVMVAGVCQTGMEDYVKQHMQEIMIHSRDHTGCFTYNIHQSENDARQFMMYSVWDKRESFELHNQRPEIEELKHKLADVFFTEQSQKTYWALLASSS